jgi:L-alanine-DL-glutamate epimerase-like enolase superfamily enzyme
VTRIRSIETFVRGPIGIVRVRTASGAVGIGQMAPFHPEIAAMILHRQIARHALGADAREIDAIGRRCLEAERKFLGSHLCRALSGLDTALWDLRGRIEGAAVCDLLGRRRDAVAIYGSCTRRDLSAAELGELLLDARRDLGAGAFKFKIGSRAGRDLDEWPGRTESVVPAMRQALGVEAMLLVDANGCYSPERAIAVGGMLEEHGVTLFEEPCPHWDLEGTAHVSRALSLDVAGGEQDFSHAQFRRIVEGRVVDVVQPDVCNVGGMTRAVGVAAMAARGGVPCTPHAANRSLVAVFALHLALAADLPAPYLEFPLASAPWTDGLYAPALRPVDGLLHAPTGHGWGVDVSRSWLRRARRGVTSDRGAAATLRRARAWRAARSASASGGQPPPAPDRR